MFLIFGMRPVRRDAKDRIPERLHCMQCGLISDFRWQSVRNYFTLFFLPLFPVSKASYIRVCNRCGSASGSPPQQQEDTDPSKSVLVCPSCSGKLRIPLRANHTLRVTCPHCRDEFTVSVNKA